MWAPSPSRERNHSLKKTPSIYLWTRGSFVFNVDFSSLLQHHSLAAINLNTVRIASNLVSYHAFHHKTSSISYAQWHRIAASKIGLSDEATFAFFSAAQTTDDSIPDAERLRRFEKGAPVEDSGLSHVPLLHLVLLVCLIGATPSESRTTRESAFRKFLLKNIDHLCRLIILCHDSYVRLFESPRDLLAVGLNQKISSDVLRNFDVLFEGAIGNFEGASAGAKAIPASELAMRFWVDSPDGISFNFLVRRIQSVLQSDPFQIAGLEDDFVEAKLNPQKTATPAADADHRSVTVRNLAGVSLIDKDYYVGSNLRVDGSDVDASTTLIALRPFRTATVANCAGRGKILLGRVEDTLFVRNVSNFCISAICRRIVVEKCTNVRLFLNCLVAPLIADNCSELMLAPYNVFDESLIEHLRREEENLYDAPVHLQGFYALNGSESPTPLIPIVEKMPVTQFYIQPTPFTNSANFQEALKKFENTIPREYCDAWKKRREKAVEAVRIGFSARSPTLCEKDKKKLLRKARSRSRRN
ncbi:hypothetical protein QR680_009046 [Steinernema hermaphroditum]|uniref:C-CAP/cofactor C-like domain-containing protein n=1 Tax=Steinernema hermaphroditum TaxID=289476 RepID=A0AA39IIU1_9BILA|nr:hypothetical protein QR680_009046 [Steinernema hermaphroditum]